MSGCHHGISEGKGLVLAVRVGVAALLAVSCRTIDPYPVCYFAAKPDVTQQKELEEGWIKDARVYLGTNAFVTVSGDGRWVFARGREADHAALRTIWPRLGCVGSYGSALSYTYYSHCLDLLQQMLASRDYLLRGKDSEFLGSFYGYCNGSSKP